VRLDRDIATKPRVEGERTAAETKAETPGEATTTSDEFEPSGSAPSSMFTRAVDRVLKHGDLFEPVLTMKQKLPRS